MKNIVSSLLMASMAVWGLCACSDDINNDQFSDMLKDRFNQELKWNPDSLAFVRADWKSSALTGGASYDKTTVKMWEGRQTVSKISYNPSMYVTRVADNPDNATLEKATLADAARQELEPIFALNGCATDFLMIDNKVIIDNASGQNDRAVLAMRESDGAMVPEILVCTPAEYPIIKAGYTDALAGGTILVENGEEAKQPESERMARSVLGINAAGNLTMLVIEASADGSADGATLAEAAFIARVSGLTNAMSLDSGEASAMWAKDGDIMTSSAANSKTSTVIYTVRNTPFDGGEGTADNPYRIATKRQLDNMHNVLEGGKMIHFELVKDIDMAGMEWIPLNYASPYDRGVVLNGNGHTISNFACSHSSYPSFFGVLYGECRNIRFKDAEIVTPGASCAGVIGGYVGTSGKPGLVEQVVVTGKVSSGTGGSNNNTQLGGIGGQLNNGTVRNCYADMLIERTKAIYNGGAGVIAGKIRNSSTIECCFAAGKVLTIKYDNAGGIVGRGEANLGWTVRDNISWVTEVTGAWSSNLVSGRLWFTGNTLGTNYSNKNATLTVFNGDDLSDPYFGTNDASVPGEATENCIEAARKSGWDENIWNLSGDTPRLQWDSK